MKVYLYIITFFLYQYSINRLILYIMTAGALVQLVAVGEQDIYLTGNPEFSFFKTVYLKHTNFSIETIEEVFYNGSDFGKQSRLIIPRKGDLISNMTLYVKLGSLNSDFYQLIEKNRNIKHVAYGNKNRINDNGDVNLDYCVCSDCLEVQYKETLKYGWVNALGHALVKSMFIEIGGQRIDKQYGEWLEIWSELILPHDKRDGYNQMIGKVDPIQFKADTFTKDMELYIPMQFWFCRSVGLALPIMSIIYQQVEFVVDFRKFNELWVSTEKKEDIIPPKKPIMNATVLIDYIYLDVDERKLFYQSSNLYLIEQLQCTGDCPVTGSIANIDLYFNHPVKELIWILQRRDVVEEPDGSWNGSCYPKGNDWFNFSTSQINNKKIKSLSDACDTFSKGLLQFNGVDRFREREASYFRIYHPLNVHTRVPKDNYIYVYSFGLDPENIRPSGTQNFSRIDDAKLNLLLKPNRTYTDYVCRVYAINYNIFIITAGMASLLFYN